MKIRAYILFVLLHCAALYSSLAQTIQLSDFRIDSVSTLTGEGSRLQVQFASSQGAPPADLATIVQNWKIFAVYKDPLSAPCIFGVDNVSVVAPYEQTRQLVVHVTRDPSQIGCNAPTAIVNPDRDPTLSSVTVAFVANKTDYKGFVPPLPSAPTPAKLFGKYTAASGRKDVQDNGGVYLNGIWIPSFGAPPLFIIDGLVNIPFSHSSSSKNQPYFGFQGQVKQDNRKRVDPDSYTFSLYWRRNQSVRETSVLRGTTFSGLQWQWDFAGVEFDRRVTTLNAVTAPKVFAVFGTPFNSNLIPVAGVELGRNVENSITNNTPAIPVKTYGTLFRGLLGVEFVKQIDRPLGETSTVLQRITLDSQYRVRLLARDESSISVIRQGGKNIDVLGSSSKPRHYLMNSIDFTLTPYFGFSIKHEYGQLPPAFPFVDHKATATFLIQLKPAR